MTSWAHLEVASRDRTSLAAFPRVEMSPTCRVTTGVGQQPSKSTRRLAWFKNARFRVTLGISARTLIGPASCSGFTRVPGCRAGASVPREPRVPQKFQPVSVRLTRQQLRGALADPTGVFTAQVPAVIQEELKQRQVVLPQLPPQEEVAAQPAVEVLDQTLARTTRSESSCTSAQTP